MITKITKKQRAYLEAKWAERRKIWDEGWEIFNTAWIKPINGGKAYEDQALSAKGIAICEVGNKLYLDAVDEITGPEASIDWKTGAIYVTINVYTPEKVLKDW